MVEMVGLLAGRGWLGPTLFKLKKGHILVVPGIDMGLHEVGHGFLQLV